jgi:hypothetical protein
VHLKYRRHSALVSNAPDGPDVIRVIAYKREPAPRHLVALAGSQKWTALTAIVCCSQTKILDVTFHNTYIINLQKNQATGIAKYYYLAGCTMFPHLPAPI